MSKDRLSAIKSLIENARHASSLHMTEVSQWDGLVRAGTLPDSSCLPGYIPYIGRDYFSTRTRGRRILAYAMSQNLYPDKDYVRAWAESWHNGDGRESLDRQNLGFESNGSTVMYPFDTGHIPILCAIIRSIMSENSSTGNCSIYQEVAATNLSKYSFRDNQDDTTDLGISHRNCWEWYSKEEVQLLDPNYILCCGELVHGVVSEGVREFPEDQRPVVLNVIFPGIQNINLHYRKDSAPSSFRDAVPGMLCEKDLNHTVDYTTVMGKSDPRLRDVLNRDMFYFSRMHAYLIEQIEGLIR